MFLLIRAIIGIGLLITLGFTLLYLLGSNERHLRIALRVLLITLAIGALLGLGIWFEHLWSGPSVK